MTDRVPAVAVALDPDALDDPGDDHPEGLDELDRMGAEFAEVLEQREEVLAADVILNGWDRGDVDGE